MSLATVRARGWLDSAANERFQMGRERWGVETTHPFPSPLKARAEGDRVPGMCVSARLRAGVEENTWLEIWNLPDGTMHEKRKIALLEEEGGGDLCERGDTLPHWDRGYCFFRKGSAPWGYRAREKPSRGASVETGETGGRHVASVGGLGSRSAPPHWVGFARGGGVLGGFHYPFFLSSLFPFLSIFIRRREYQRSSVLLLADDWANSPPLPSLLIVT